MMSPKSGLRHPKAVSTLEECSGLARSSVF